MSDLKNLKAGDEVAICEMRHSHTLKSHGVVKKAGNRSVTLEDGRIFSTLSGWVHLKKGERDGCFIVAWEPGFAKDVAKSEHLRMFFRLTVTNWRSVPAPMLARIIEILDEVEAP